MDVSKLMRNSLKAASIMPEAAASRNPRVFASFLRPGYRGLILQKGKNEAATTLPVAYETTFDWRYQRGEMPKMQQLYEMAKGSQWNAAKDIDWSIEVDPYNPERPILSDRLVPAQSMATWKTMSESEKGQFRHAFLSWIFSQFLHGEQGALFATAQVTTAVPWVDGKLFGGTQVVDEARHLEVFHTYLSQKLRKVYKINDNLYVVLDALMSDSRWDLKFLGMQIMVEGLALGAFRTFYELLDEPLLKQILDYVIRDEARHVHYGVLALSRSRRLGVRGFTPASKPFSGTRAVRGVLCPPDETLGVGQGGPGIGNDGPLPEEHVQTDRPQPEADRPVERQGQRPVRVDGRSGLRKGEGRSRAFPQGDHGRRRGRGPRGGGAASRLSGSWMGWWR